MLDLLLSEVVKLSWEVAAAGADVGVRLRVGVGACARRGGAGGIIVGATAVGGGENIVAGGGDGREGGKSRGQSRDGRGAGETIQHSVG